MLIFRICVFEEKYSTQQDARVKKDHQRLSRMREGTEKKRSIQQKLRTFKKIGRIHFEKSAITKKMVENYYWFVYTLLSSSSGLDRMPDSNSEMVFSEIKQLQRRRC